MSRTEKSFHLVHRAVTGAVLLVLGACSSSDPASGPPTATPDPVIVSFTADPAAVSVGERVRLTAVFTGEGASIDGIGPVESGLAVETRALARTTTFTLKVRSGEREAQGDVTVAARYRDRFRTLTPSPVARTHHLTLALSDGGALIVGGNSSETLNVPDSDTTQRFDPLTERMSSGPPLAFTAEAGFTLAALPAGQPLLVGAGPNGPFGRGRSLATQALEPTGAFAREGDLLLDHGSGGAATALGDGRVLVSGGSVPGSRKVEVRDPASGEWGVTGDLLVGRRGHTATVLPDGRVLVVGGITCCTKAGEVFTGSAELYDPVEGSSTPTGPLALARGFHEATLLSDGRVLVTGGIAGVPAAPIARTELYDPATGAFTAAGDLQVARAGHAAIVLGDDRVLVLGGFEASSVSELFDAGERRWTPGPKVDPPWAESTATRLANGKVLVFGGQDEAGFPVSTVQLFE